MCETSLGLAEGCSGAWSGALFQGREPVPPQSPELGEETVVLIKNQQLTHSKKLDIILKVLKETDYQKKKKKSVATLSLHILLFKFVGFFKKAFCILKIQQYNSSWKDSQAFVTGQQQEVERRDSCCGSCLPMWGDCREVTVPQRGQGQGLGRGLAGRQPGGQRRELAGWIFQRAKLAQRA